MRHLFIINPASCRGKAIQYVEQISDIFASSDDEYFIEMTSKIGDATEIVRKYTSKNTYRVYSIGGDGTLNEVLNGVVGSDSCLGVIPAGSGNDFFRNLGSKADKSILLRTIKGVEKEIDIGKINDTHFLSVASAGIDAQIVVNSEKFRKIPLIHGMASYIAGIFYTVFKYRGFESTITIDETFNKKPSDNQAKSQDESIQRTLTGKSLLIAICNGKYYGGGMKVAPKADLNDGQLDICHVKPVSPIRIIFLFTKLIKGVHESIKEVSFYKAKSVRIKANKDFPLNIDGETQLVKEANFDIVPNGVSIVFPSDS